MTHRERINTGHAALSTDADATVVHGIALGAGDTTVGGSGKETLWPADVLKDAADKLEGQPIATDTDHTATDPKPQTPVESIRGEVRWSGYGEVDGQEGILYEAAIDDESLARKVQNGRVEVSPLLSRDIEPLASGEADYVATEIHDFRDLALVRSGASPSATIQPGANPAKAEALHAAVTDAKGGPSEEALAKAKALKSDIENLQNLSAVDSLKEDVASLMGTTSYEEARSKLERL